MDKFDITYKVKIAEKARTYSTMEFTFQTYEMAKGFINDVLNVADNGHEYIVTIEKERKEW